MDFHALPRRDLQALAKRNGVRANMSNVAMADALAALPKVDGIDEYVKEPVVEPTPAAEPEVQAATEEEEKQAPAAEEQKQEATAPEEEEEEEEEEREKQEISLPGGTSALKPQEVIMLDDSEEEEKGLMPDLDEEKAPARGVGRRRAIRCAPVEPVAAPATRKRGTAASKAEPAEAVPARTTRARSQRTEVSAAEEGAPKARRTSRRAAASMTGINQEEEEKDTQGDVSDMETDVPAPVSSDEGGDRAEEMEAPMDAQDKEQNEPVEEQRKEDEGETETGDAAAEAVPARATRARSKRTVESVAEDDAPKARRTSRRAAARKTSTEQEEEEKRTQGDVSDVEAAVPALVSAEDDAPKARRTSRRAAARKTSTEQEDEEKRTQGDVSDVEAAVPALVSSDEGGDGAEKMEVAVDAQNEEQNGPVEEESQEDEGEEAVPARATRARRQRTVVSAAEEEAPKVRRTSRRAVARKTSTEQEEEEKAAERDVSEMEAAMPAPVSSDKGGDGAEEMEAAMDAQNEEQLAAAEAVPARPTRSRRQRAVMSAAEEEAPKARRTSRSAVARKTSTEQEEEEKRAQGDVSVMEAAVPAPSSDDSAEDMEAAVDAQNEEQHELVEEQSPDNEGVVVDIPAPVEEEPPVAEDCMVDSSVEEQLVGVQQCDGSPVVLGLSEQEGSDGFQNDAVSIEGVHHASEDTEIVAVDKVLQTPLKSGEAIEEVDFTSSVGHASEEKEVPTSEEVLQSAVKAIDEQEDMAADGVTNNTDVSVEDMAGHTSEENEDCTAEDEPLVAEDVDSSVQELLVQVQQCEETHLAGEDTEVVPVNEVPQAMLESGEAMEEVDCTSDVGELNEDCTVEEEPLVAEHVGSSQQEPLVDVQQCEATEEEIHLAGEDAETVPVNEVPQATTEEVDFTSNAGHVTVEEELTMAADVDSPVQGPPVAVQQCEATEEIHLVVEVTEMVPQAMMKWHEMQLTSATMYKSVEEMDTVDNLSQATVTDDEWAVKESALTGDCTPVVDTATDFSDHIASLLSANVFEDATKSLSMDSITVEPMVSEPADVPLFMYGSSGGEKNASVPLSVQQEKEVKVGNEPDALGSFSTRKLRIKLKEKVAVAQESVADGVPLFMYGSSGGEKNASVPLSVQQEKEVKVGNEPDALGSFSTRKLSALGSCSTRKLRIKLKEKVAVAQESVADGVPLCIFSSIGGEENSAEPVVVEREKECNESEALDSHSLRKLRIELNEKVAVAQEKVAVAQEKVAVAQESVADGVPLCIFSSIGGEENSAEPVVVEREKECNESEALDSHSLRKLRIELNEKVAVAQENEVKEGEKSSVPLDKLSLRKLRIKLRETLNAQKNMEPKRVPLGRLDENAY